MQWQCNRGGPRVHICISGIGISKVPQISFLSHTCNHLLKEKKSCGSIQKEILPPISLVYLFFFFVWEHFLPCHIKVTPSPLTPISDERRRRPKSKPKIDFWAPHHLTPFPLRVKVLKHFPPPLYVGKRKKSDATGFGISIFFSYGKLDGARCINSGEMCVITSHVIARKKVRKNCTSVRD